MRGGWFTMDSLGNTPLFKDECSTYFLSQIWIFRWSDYVKKFEDKNEAFQWCGLPHLARMILSGHRVRICRCGSSSWSMASHLVTLSWPGMRQGLCHRLSYGKQILSSLCGKQNHIMCEATSWDPNFVLTVPSPLTIYFSKWKLNCFIKFPNATFTKQKRQSKQKLPRLKGINAKTKEWIMMFSRNN